MTTTVTAETIARDIALVCAVLTEHGIVPDSLTYIRARVTVEVTAAEAGRLADPLSLGEPEVFTGGTIWRRGNVGGVNVSVRHPRPATHSCAAADCTHGTDS